MKQNGPTWFSHMLSTIGIATSYVILICIVLCIIGLIIAKIIYHIYLNCLLILYAFSVKSWETVNIKSVDESYNMLCSISLFNAVTNDNQIKYYDLNIVTEKFNVTAYCINEKLINHVKKDILQYVTSYVGSDYIYAGNIIEMYETLLIIFLCGFTFGCVFYGIYRSCVNIK